MTSEEKQVDQDCPRRQESVSNITKAGRPTQLCYKLLNPILLWLTQQRLTPPPQQVFSRSVWIFTPTPCHRVTWTRGSSWSAYRSSADTGSILLRGRQWSLGRQECSGLQHRSTTKIESDSVGVPLFLLCLGLVFSKTPLNTGSHLWSFLFLSVHGLQSSSPALLRVVSYVRPCLPVITCLSLPLMAATCVHSCCGPGSSSVSLSALLLPLCSGCALVPGDSGFVFFSAVSFRLLLVVN